MSNINNHEVSNKSKTAAIFAGIILAVTGAKLPASATVPTTISQQEIGGQPTMLLYANRQNNVCKVANIKTGRLALRESPNGKYIASLDNGNQVQLVLTYDAGEWSFVYIIKRPKPEVDKLLGWVNSKYILCG